MVDFVANGEIFEVWFANKNGDPLSEIVNYLEKKCGRTLTEAEKDRANILPSNIKRTFKGFKNKEKFFECRSSWLQSNFYFDLIDVSTRTKPKNFR